MDRLLSSDVILHALSYLSARDGGRAMCCCRRFVYLIEALRGGMEPELIALSSKTLAAIEKEEEAEEEEHLERKRGGRGGAAEAAVEANAARAPGDGKRGTRVTPPRACSRRRTTRTTRTTTPAAPRPRRATSTSTSTSMPGRVISRCADHMRAPPDVAFIFHGDGRAGEASANWPGEAERLLPPGAAIIGASSHWGIQTNCLGGGGGTVEVESDSDFCCMVGSFPGAHFVPFELETASRCGRHPGPAAPIDEMRRILAESRSRRRDVRVEDDDGAAGDDASYWRVFIVYVVGDGYTYAPTFIERLQRLHPDALIVGGICDEVDIGCGRGTVQMTDGICGLAVGGEFPGRAVVSRGVRSVTTSADPRQVPVLGGGVIGADPRDPVAAVVGGHGDGDGDGDGDGSWSVGESDVLPDRPGIRVIRSVRNDVTGSTMSAGDFVDRSNGADYIGLKPGGSGGDGFTLETPLSVGVDGIYMDGGSVEDARRFLPGAKIDLFELDGEACVRDLDGNLSLLREQLRGEKLLGAVMFSCSGRGPKADLLPEDMADATGFARYFPSMPCVGFYGGGEIGPRAMVGGRGVFRRGGATLQGYTAVFLVFVVPAQKASHGAIDDSLGNIARHMESRRLRHANFQRLRNDAFFQG